MILQKYDFSSKSQRAHGRALLRDSCLWYCKSTIFQANHNLWRRGVWFGRCCLWYCKSTIFQANHNRLILREDVGIAVCDTAKVRFFKQITTTSRHALINFGCLWYCKSTIFQANHNWGQFERVRGQAVCDTAKVRFFKQITTICHN